MDQHQNPPSLLLPAPAPQEFLTEMAPNRAVRLHNRICPYCAAPLTKKTRTKEHVIGRRFVPRGKLDGNWNLIVWACLRCNREKADLEDDLSCISMLPDCYGQYAEADPVLIADSVRKAQRSISRRTKRPIADSAEHVTINNMLAPGVQMTFNLVSPPQASSERVFDLARLQLMGFFFWNSFDSKEQVGRFWLGGFHPIIEAKRADWGNSVHRGFMETVISWDPRVIATSADGYFKVAIRKHRSEICWSWALEWNRQFRVVGFFGNRSVAEAVAQKFLHLEKRTIYQNGRDWIKMRNEQPLADQHDILFAYDDSELPPNLRSENSDPIVASQAANS
jgi:hypothetical protein